MSKPFPRPMIHVELRERIYRWLRTRGWRVVVMLIVAACAAWLSWTAHPTVYGGVRSDFAMLHAAATAWLAGSDPYEAVGPGRAYHVGHGVLYPMPAVLLAVPFTVVSWADVAFAACGAALLAWALSGSSRFRYAWFVFLTPAFIYTIRMTQWSAFMAGAALVPVWGFLLAAKPTSRFTCSSSASLGQGRSWPR